MAVLVIAGSGRNAGKTAVGCALIQAIPELRWTAVKVTPHKHEVQGVGRHMAARVEKDTDRYLAAGAKRSFLVVRSETGDDLTKAIARSLGRTADKPCANESLLVESNRVSVASVAASDEPGLCIAVLAGPVVYWKSSLMECVTAADALVLTGGFCCEELPASLRSKRVFQMIPGSFSSQELMGFVRGRFRVKAN